MASVKEENSMEKQENSNVKTENGINTERPDYDVLASRVTAISRPLASRKLTKKIYKLIKKG